MWLRAPEVLRAVTCCEAAVGDGIGIASAAGLFGDLIAFRSAAVTPVEAPIDGGETLGVLIRSSSAKSKAADAAAALAAADERVGLAGGVALEEGGFIPSSIAFEN